MLTLNALRVVRASRPDLDVAHARSGPPAPEPPGPDGTAILDAPMMKFLSRLVDSNEREVRRLEPLVAAINELEPEYEAMSDAELRGVTATLRARLQDELGELLTPIELRDVPPGEEEETELAGDDPARHSEERKEQRKREREQIDAALEEVLPEAFAAVREAMKRALGKRHYDVQLIGGIGAPSRGHRRDEDRRGQDLRGAAGRLPERADRSRRARGDSQRLPGQARRAVDRRRLPSARHERSAASSTTPPTSTTRTSRRPMSACATCARSRAARPMPPMSRTAPTTSSASTTCGTTWSSTWRSASSAATSSRSSTRSTTS